MGDTNYKLRAWMGANRVTQERLADLLQMPVRRLQTRLTEETQWKLSEIEALISITGLSFDELF